MAKGTTRAKVAKAEPAVDIVLLGTIVAATETVGYTMIDPASASVNQLVRFQYIELNVEMTENDKTACRATAEGITFFNANKPADAAKVKEEVTTMLANGVSTFNLYEIDNDVPMPAVGKRGGFGRGRAVQYPYEQLNVGDSFHIAATEKCPEPHKSRASLISLWNNKHAVMDGAEKLVKVSEYQVDEKGKRVRLNGHFVKTGEKMVTRKEKSYSKKFAIVAVDASDKRGAGARVYRVA